MKLILSFVLGAITTGIILLAKSGTNTDTRSSFSHTFMKLYAEANESSGRNIAFLFEEDSIATFSITSPESTEYILTLRQSGFPQMIVNPTNQELLILFSDRRELLVSFSTESGLPKLLSVTSHDENGARATVDRGVKGVYGETIKFGRDGTVTRNIIDEKTN